jgi:hypothetical protein
MAHKNRAKSSDLESCGTPLTQLQFVENGGFAGGIQAKHQTASFAVLEPFLEDPEEATHGEMRLFVRHSILCGDRRLPVVDW